VTSGEPKGTSVWMIEALWPARSSSAVESLSPLLAALDVLAVEPAELFYAALRPAEASRTEKRVTVMEPEAERYRVEEALRVARRATETG